jgi:hypothetical protein
VICTGEQIRMTGKPPKIYAKTGDNGRTRFQHFCTECGSPLFTSGEGNEADDWGIRWGSIRQRDRLKPARQIWCRSAVPWIHEVAGLPGPAHGVAYCLSMIFSENRRPLFRIIRIIRIMLWLAARGTGG